MFYIKTVYSEILVFIFDLYNVLAANHFPTIHEASAFLNVAICVILELPSQTNIFPVTTYRFWRNLRQF